MSQTPDKQHSSEDHDEKPIRQHKELCGALFVNRKKKNNGQPDRTGTCTINGVGYRMAGWIKKDGEGNAYLSMSFSIPTRKEDL